MFDLKDWLAHGLLFKGIARANSVELREFEYELSRAETAMKADTKTPVVWWGVLDKYRLAVAERREKTWF